MITKEQYRAAMSAYTRRMRHFKARSKMFTRILVILFSLFAAAFVIFILLRVFGKINAGKIFAVLSALFALGFAAIYTIQYLYSEKVSFMNDHIKPDKYIIAASNAVLDAPFTPAAEKAVNSALAAETDSKRCAYLRALLFDHNCVTGDFDSACRALFKDEELFRTDKFAELRYYANLVNYYVSCPSTTGSTEYAEEAYRMFEKVYNEYAPTTDDFQAINYAMDVMIIISYHRGDWQLCYDLSSLRLDLFVRKSGDSPVTEPALAVDKVMQADCLNHLGNYKEALRLCEEALPKLAGIKYQASKANRLAEQLRRSLSDIEDTENDPHDN